MTESRPADDVLAEIVLLAITGVELDADPRAATQARLLDTIGAGLAAVDGPEALAVRRLTTTAAAGPASVLGTEITCAPELAAFVNAATARAAELNDVYFAAHGGGGHPSDVVMPVLAAAQAAGASGPELLVALATAYEIYTRLIDTYRIESDGFDHTSYAAIAGAAAAGRLAGLDSERLADCVAIAAVSGVGLRRVRTGTLTMWKAVASGQAARQALWSAQLAGAGVEGPVAPFTGPSGWLTVLAHAPAQGLPPHAAGALGVERTLIKPRAACMSTMSSALAAEKLHEQLAGRLDEIATVRVETYASARDRSGIDAVHWHAATREEADHSIPYVAAVALIDGPVGPAQFAAGRVVGGDVRDVVARTEVVAPDSFTAANRADPTQRPTRVTVRLRDGAEVAGEVRTLKGDLADPMTASELAAKFRHFTTPTLRSDRQDAVVAAVAALDRAPDLSQLVAALVP